jgi:predicted transcriptional regulator
MANITSQDAQIAPTSGDGIFDKFKKVGSALGELGTSVADGTSDLIGGTKAGRIAQEIGGKVIDGAKDVGRNISVATDKIGSNLSGEEAHTRIKELVAQQTRYNDILATRLAEALDRIEVLEKEMKALSHDR